MTASITFSHQGNVPKTPFPQTATVYWNILKEYTNKHLHGISVYLANYSSPLQLVTDGNYQMVSWKLYGQPFLQLLTHLLSTSIASAKQAVEQSVALVWRLTWAVPPCVVAKIVRTSKQRMLTKTFYLFLILPMLSKIAKMTMTSSKSDSWG